MLITLNNLIDYCIRRIAVTPTLIAVVLLLGGCTMLAKPIEPPGAETAIIDDKTATTTAPTPAPIPVPDPAPLPTPIEKTPKPALPQATLEQPKPLHAAIIISRNIENHRQLSAEIGQLITRQNGTYTPFYLYQQEAADIVVQVKNGAYRQVVAIGLAAAQATKMLPQMPVIFCQIYNYQDYDLITEYRKGVSLIPAIDQQFKAWKTVLPELNRVGVIVGEGKQASIENATATAAAYGITLVSRTVNNDKAMWEGFRRLVAQIDGFWLLPDNRILSKRTLRNMVEYSSKHTTPLFTVNGLLLKAGAMMSAAQVDHDIAEKVIARLLTILPDNTIPGVAVTPLDAAHISLNTLTAKQFNILIPQNITESQIERWPSQRDSATLTR